MKLSIRAWRRAEALGPRLPIAKSVNHPKGLKSWSTCSLPQMMTNVALHPQLLPAPRSPVACGCLQGSAQAVSLFTVYSSSGASRPPGPCVCPLPSTHLFP